MALGMDMDKAGKRIAGTNAIGLKHLIFVDLDTQVQILLYHD